VSAPLPRAVHPVAWWIWALGLAAAASLTPNPIVLGTILTVAGIVVMARRTDAPWARAFRAYLVLGLVVVCIRMVFLVVLGGTAIARGHVLLRVPEVPLPGFMRGITLGGPVSLESVAFALYDGLRLATVLCCVGAANALANPKRALRALPGALYELGVAITVALTVAPQLVESVQRVRRARRLRGATDKGRRAVRATAMPVLEDALARSFRLAAAMDSRGYGRTAAVPHRLRRATGVLLIAALGGLCIGAYGVLDVTTPRWLGLPMFAFGLACAGAGVFIGSRRVSRTTYRPDVWAGAEWLTAACGVVAVAATVVAAHLEPAALNPSIVPLAWPAVPPIALAGIALAILPAWCTPPPVSTTIDLMATTPAPRTRALATAEAAP
jgi:energy-coupling factor transport system permease protein